MAQEELLYAELVSAQNMAGGVNPQSGASGVAIAISGTVNASTRTAKVLPGSAVTSCIVQAGQFDGQDLTIVNVAQVAGSSVSFAAAGSAAGSSRLATVVVISGLTAAAFKWDSVSAVWYPVIN